MNFNRLLVITSLLSILLMSLHFTDDIVRGISAAGIENLGAVAILVVWLCGTLLLGTRVSGHIIMLLGAIFAAAMPVLHFSGAKFPELVRSDGGFFFLWSVLMLGVLGVFSFVLAVLGLWKLFRSRAETS